MKIETAGISFPNISQELDDIYAFYATPLYYGPLYIDHSVCTSLNDENKSKYQLTTLK